MKAKINVPTIPLPEAVDRVKRFRTQFSAQAAAGQEIPRAVLIPIADILSIIDKFQFIDDDGNVRTEIKGVRAYFAIKESDMALPDDVTALIVPVDLKGNDIITTSKVKGPDDDGDGDDEDSDIYDFTKPCPTECDPESPLFVE